MRIFIFLAFFWAIFFPVSAYTSTAGQQNKPTEKQKIDMLISYVGTLKGAVFIRNGSEHSPAEACEHLRHKLSKAGNRIKTARDFIDQCASVSSMSGKKYTIRTSDGRERPSRDVLIEQLNLIEKSKG